MSVCVLCVCVCVCVCGTAVDKQLQISVHVMVSIPSLPQPPPFSSPSSHLLHSPSKEGEEVTYARYRSPGHRRAKVLHLHKAEGQ